LDVVRSLDWRDLTLLHRVRGNGLCFHAQMAYTRGPNALQNALLDVITAGRSAWTLVVRPTDPAEPPGVAQCMQHNEDPYARLTFLGPLEILGTSSGQRLLEALARTAGERGAHNLIAEVDEHSPAFECLRHAGFGIHSRQRIWRLGGAGNGAAPLSHPSAHSRAVLGESPSSWRSEAPSDQAAIQNLLMSLVPARVHQVEPAATHGGRGYVYWPEKELLGYLDVDRGPLGIWLQPFFHPAAENLDQLLQAILGLLEGRRDRPFYVCVRSYQSWLSSPLEGLGFETCLDQAVMVKRLAVSIRQPAAAPIPSLEGTRAKPTAPVAHLENSAPTHRIRGR